MSCRLVVRSHISSVRAVRQCIFYHTSVDRDKQGYRHLARRRQARVFHMDKHTCKHSFVLADVDNVYPHTTRRNITVHGRAGCF
jgi:hypothetical protein